MLADFTVQSNIYAYLQVDRGKEAAYRIRSNFFFSFVLSSRAPISLGIAKKVMVLIILTAEAGKTTSQIH